MCRKLSGGESGESNRNIIWQDDMEKENKKKWSRSSLYFGQKSYFSPLFWPDHTPASSSNLPYDNLSHKSLQYIQNHSSQALNPFVPRQWLRSVGTTTEHTQELGRLEYIAEFITRKEKGINRCRVLGSIHHCYRETSKGRRWWENSNTLKL